MDTCHTVLDTALGDLSVVVDDVGVCGIYFPEHWTRPDETRWGPRRPVSHDVRFGAVAEQLDAFMGGTRRDFDLPLSLVGSERSRRVWRLLQAIPYAEATTYGALAAEVGTHARAVGWAVAHNPVSVVVPCHRVVGSDGRLTGYAGGLERKERLLALEGSLAQSGLF